MKLTTKFRYGTRALLDLALHSDGGPTSLKEIAGRQDLSLKYLENLFAVLQAAGLVRSVRGAQGGYQLALPPNEITVRQLYEVLEGPGPLVDCTAEPVLCARSEGCVTHQVWSNLYQLCMEFLGSITLRDLMDRAESIQFQFSAYYI
jgi:Rrf2 family transcriptional regulator, cysteine metabolism repressor